MIILLNQQSPQAERLRQRITAEFPTDTIRWIDRDGQTLADGDPAEVFLRHEIGRDVLVRILQDHPTLRWMHTVSAGVDHILPVIRQYAPPGLMLTKGRGTMAQPIAEYVLGQMIAALKGFSAYASAQREHNWQRRGVTARDLRGATVLILGLGAIGMETARLASGVGMRVWGVKRGPATPVDGVERVLGGQAASGQPTAPGGPDDWRTLLPEVDILVVAMPLTAETRHSIGAAELAALRPDSWVINIARGALIDEAALTTALQEQRIGGAVLDVTEVEPLPADSPLWDQANAIITPHISWRSPRVEDAMGDLFMENLRRYHAGEPLVNLVPEGSDY